MGAPKVDLFAPTSGTDSDWVAKLIDVYPDDVPEPADQGGQAVPGHRIMVQVQSTLFPLCDRNSQSYVANVMDAEPGDYRRETQSIWHGGATASGDAADRLARRCERPCSYAMSGADGSAACVRHSDRLRQSRRTCP